MNVYVVTYEDGTQSRYFLNGAYGVFSTWEKAQYAVFEYIAHEKDTLLNTDAEPMTMMLFFTKQGTWKIEQIEIDSTGL